MMQSTSIRLAAWLLRQMAPDYSVTHNLGANPNTMVVRNRLGDRQLIAFNWLVSHNYSTRGSAAIVGNLVQESGPDLRSTYLAANKTDHGSQGIAQWRLDRLTNLEKYAQSNGRNVELLETQLAFLDYELRHDYNKLYAQLCSPGDRTIENLTANFSAQFERPSKKYEHLDKRIKYARAVYRRSGLLE